MRIKCNDGIVRDFKPAREDITWGMCESQCNQCGQSLGCNDTKIAKKVWKNHICKVRETEIASTKEE